MSDSLRYWADYLASNRAERLDNSFASTVALREGVDRGPL